MSIRYGCLQEGRPTVAEIWQRRSPCCLSPLLIADQVERRLPRTRRESEEALPIEAGLLPDPFFQRRVDSEGRRRDQLRADRKSTRLNSSHSQISYAVFCLKKKKQD